MKINKHLMKKTPQYKVKGKDYSVKLTVVVKTRDGLSFSAEIMDGEHKGKWTTVNKSQLELMK